MELVGLEAWSLRIGSRYEELISSRKCERRRSFRRSRSTASHCCDLVGGFRMLITNVLLLITGGCPLEVVSEDVAAVLLIATMQDSAWLVWFWREDLLKKGFTCEDDSVCAWEFEGVGLSQRHNAKMRD